MPSHTGTAGRAGDTREKGTPTLNSFFSLPGLLIYLATIALVVWGVADAARRPSSVLPSKQKAAWVLGMVVGWLLLGLVGAVVAVVYLMGPRKRLNARTW